MGKKAKKGLKGPKFTWMVQYEALKKCKCLNKGNGPHSQNIPTFMISPCIKHSTLFYYKQ